VKVVKVPFATMPPVETICVGKFRVTGLVASISTAAPE
jgi:hypothetical protein